jgi:hypothetical protein
VRDKQTIHGGVRQRQHVRPHERGRASPLVRPCHNSLL